jgi:hypothetical protein
MRSSRGGPARCTDPASAAFTTVSTQPRHSVLSGLSFDIRGRSQVLPCAASSAPCVRLARRVDGEAATRRVAASGKIIQPRAPVLITRGDTNLNSECCISMTILRLFCTHPNSCAQIMHCVVGTDRCPPSLGPFPSRCRCEQIGLGVFDPGQVAMFS